ncbi:MAG: ferrous iron transport protein B [Sporomusaceae bacterium]|nr:ferrous iron transport protein B [Sporomusaceae bacterium]
MSIIKIALAGNPNCGKTTLFNKLTGSNQYVGNWPGVTVEKKEGKLKTNDEVIVTDLPGIYSLSPYTLEEVVARNYLIEERPDVILNIVDGTNLERNLYLTTQLTEIGIPVVVAINMMDIVKKNSDVIDTASLAKALGCQIVEISALRGEGIIDAAEAAIKMAKGGKTVPKHSFSGTVEHVLAHIEEAVLHNLPEEQQRWYAIKLFERDEKVIAKLNLGQQAMDHIAADIAGCEKELDDDSESIIISERYNYIETIIKKFYQVKDAHKLSVSEQIDRVVTNRFLALPVFAAVIFLIYFISVTTVGSLATDWANDGVFGEGWYLWGEGSLWIPGVPVIIGGILESLNCAEWLRGLILDGMVAGVGAVLGFVPQMLILFMFLAFLEGCGYMARIAFILDRIFRKFGLSGHSFIPILVGTGCGVPAIMASRTIKSDRDRKMTIMTTTFIPCSAKLPVIALFAGAIFNGEWWVAPSAYFAGIASIICSGIILKKTKLFAGDVTPFVMELPPYHLPLAINIFRSVMERCFSFVKKAGTIILLSTVVIWGSSNFGFADGSFCMVDMENSLLADFGNAIAWLFAPLGWGNWQAAVASVTGLIAKENVVGTLGILFGYAEVSENAAEIWGPLAANFTAISAYSFLIFNLLCAPCFAAMGAIRREMNNPRWFFLAIGYQCVFAYLVALCLYQLGTFFTTGEAGIGTAVAFFITGAFLYQLFRKQPVYENQKISSAKEVKA